MIQVDKKVVSLKDKRGKVLMSVKDRP